MAEQARDIESIVIDDSPSPPKPSSSSKSVEIISVVPPMRSYRGIGARPSSSSMATSTTSSKRKRRPRQPPLVLTPVSTSIRREMALSQTVPNNNKKRKRSPDFDGAQSARRQKRKVTKTYGRPKPPTKCLRNTNHLSFSLPLRRSARLRHRGKVKASPDTIDLCSDHEEEITPKSSPETESNDKMSVDEEAEAEDDDEDLVQNEENDDVVGVQRLKCTVNDIQNRSCYPTNQFSNLRPIDVLSQESAPPNNDDVQCPIDLTSRKISAQHSNSKNGEADSKMDVDDIDLNDIEIPAIGIAIGTHRDFWDCSAFSDRPKVAINKHSNSIDLHLKSHLDESVTVSIDTANIQSLYLPANPSLFRMEDLKGINPSRIDAVDEEKDVEVTPHIQALFIQTKSRLDSYKWLEPYYDPNDITAPGIERITLFLGRQQYDKLNSLVLNRNHFCQVTDAVQRVGYDV